MKNILKPSFILSGFFFAASAFAALPTSPLDSEYTIESDEILGLNEKYQIGATGILNIGANGADASLTMSYDADAVLLKNDGILNIGTGTAAGTLNIVGSYTGEIKYGNQLVNSMGTLNLGVNGTINVSGAGYFKWNSYIHFENANIKGKIIYTATKGEGYLSFKNLNFYEGAVIDSKKNLQMRQGTWNLYSNAITAPELRFFSKNSVLNLQCEDALLNVKLITLDQPNDEGRINVGNYSQYLSTIAFCNNSKLTIRLADDKENNGFILRGLRQKESGIDYNANLTFENFANDFVKIENISNLQIVGNKLYIESANTYITLTAYDSEGNLIEGDWYFEEHFTGMHILNNTGYIPETATIASVLGIIALGAVAYRRRK